MTNEDRYGGYTPARATRFFIPLLLQAFSQSLTYPLVAAIITHGRDGVAGYTAFAQGQTVMFMIGAIGGGLVMAGMVFARVRDGFRSFLRLNALVTTVLIAVEILLSLPPFDRLVFQSLLTLPPELAETARLTLLFGVFMQLAFFLRNVPLVVLLNNRASFEANVASLIRIGVTALTPFFFIRLGWTGAMWGLLAMTVPCYIEFLLTWYYARPFLRKLRANDIPPEHLRATPADTSLRQQFRFLVPLGLGNFLLAAAPFVIAAFVGRTQDGVAMLAVHYLTIGIANPVGYASLRMQPVAIQFPPEYQHDRRVIKFAACAGLILGLLPLLGTLPGIGHWYFCTLQNLDEKSLTLARLVMIGYAVWPLLQCLRGHAEGSAAVLKRPSVILYGQFAYFGTLLAVLVLCAVLHLPGWTMGATAILSACAVTVLALHALISRAARDGSPCRA